MIIKVSGVSAASLFTKDLPQKNQIKFYKESTPKEKVKIDFGIVLDKEIKKLHFEKIV